jgi:hypothetical protein
VQDSLFICLLFPIVAFRRWNVKKVNDDDVLILSLQQLCSILGPDGQGLFVDGRNVRQQFRGELA